MLVFNETDMLEGVAKMRKRTYPMNNLDILNVVYLETWLKVSISTRIHTKHCAIVVWCWRKRTECGSRKERYIEAEQDSAEADKEWRGEIS